MAHSLESPPPSPAMTARMILASSLLFYGLFLHKDIQIVSWLCISWRKLLGGAEGGDVTVYFCEPDLDFDNLKE
jgi:hypothetical protein